jgi:hypothetical protein
MDPHQNPYTPGAGARPPRLVGRDAEIKDFGVAFKRLAGERRHRGNAIAGCLLRRTLPSSPKARPAGRRSTIAFAARRVVRRRRRRTSASSRGRRRMLGGENWWPSAGRTGGRGWRAVTCQAVLMVRWLWIFSRLCVAVTNRHSDRAADLPLRMNRSIRRLCLIWPNTGSTVILRWA